MDLSDGCISSYNYTRSFIASATLTNGFLALSIGMYTNTTFTTRHTALKQKWSHLSWASYDINMWSIMELVNSHACPCEFLEVW
jgi:hypothetical protein